MDVSRIAKDYTRLQKQSLNNLFDTMTLFQEHADRTSGYWAYQMGLSTNARSTSDQYRAVFMQGREYARKLIDQSLP